MLHQKITEQLDTVVKEAFFKAFHQSLQKLHWETPPKREYGDTAIACFSYASQLRQNPHNIAKQWLQHMHLPEIISQSSVQGAYINFSFDKHKLAKFLFSDFKHSDSLFAKVGQNKEVLIEFSSPNANKPLHLGHGRNNALGLFLSRLYKLLGYKVYKVNLINDRGIHICKSMLAYQLLAEGASPQSANKKGDHFVGDYYVQFSKLEKEDSKYLSAAHSMLKKWEEGDPQTIQLWKKMTNWAIAGLKETYQRAGINFDEYYLESKLYLGGKAIVQQALQDNICSLEENKAISISLEEYNLDKKILQRGDGTSVYITQDIYTAVKKFTEHNLHKSLWVVGSEQDHYFKVLFAILKKLGYEWANSCHHVSYGMIELPEGKMKSREGKTVDLDDLYDDLQHRAVNVLLEKNSKFDQDEQKLHSIAEAVGQAAINFYILKADSNKNITFNYDEALSFDGMSGPYLQYTFTRINSLLSNSHQSDYIVDASSDNLQEVEIELLLAGYWFSKVVYDSHLSHNPGQIANYSYELCRNFNRFYQQLPILKANTSKIKEFRINLTLLVRDILRKCFYLLNIPQIERM